MKEYAEIFKVLGDQTRLRILHLLLKIDGELCVCELTDSLEVHQYNISRHLKILKHVGLLEERREGHWVYFSITKDKDSFIKSVLKSIACIHQPILSRDLEGLNQRLNIRIDGKCLLGIQKKHLLCKIKETIG